MGSPPPRPLAEPLRPGETRNQRDARRAREKRDQRLAARVPDQSGHLVSTIAPPDVHGTPTGYSAWCCRCFACRAARHPNRGPEHRWVDGHRVRRTNHQETP